MDDGTKQLAEKLLCFDLLLICFAKPFSNVFKNEWNEARQEELRHFKYRWHTA